jgi:hypothetical protein
MNNERVGIEYAHCQGCRCTLLQDNLRLPWMYGSTLGVGYLKAYRLEDNSSFCLTTDGHWFGRTSVPDVDDESMDNPPGLGNTKSPPCVSSISSSSNLVCSSTAVSALPYGGLLGQELPLGGALAQDCTYSRTNQAPGRDDHAMDISEGLVRFR